MIDSAFPSPFSAKLPHPIVLCILDGWGDRHENTNVENNPLLKAKIPTWCFLEKTFPHALLDASGEAVGLPKGQMGNSEVGHLTIGTGRTILQDFPRIDKALQEGFLETSPIIQKTITSLQKSGKTFHLLGLFSPGGVHSHIRHLEMLVSYFNTYKIPVYVHAILDGRDTPPKSALSFYKEFEAKILNKLKYPTLFHIGTVCGRFYAMDRDKRWDRIQKAYEAIAEGEGSKAEDFYAAIEQAYTQNSTDEFIIPTVIGDYKGIKDQDALLCFNFRADRVCQILNSLLSPTFCDFPRKKRPLLSYAIGFTEYSTYLDPYIQTLFKQESFPNILGKIFSDAELAQLRLAETEKYAHVTFFFNGGKEKAFPREYRHLVPSPKVTTYDLCPEMSAKEITDILTDCLLKRQFDIYIVNFANPDMVGHTGNIPAAIKAVEYIDVCLKRLYEATKASQSYLFITADHGNVELMKDPITHVPHTAHTCFLVPFLMINAPKGWTLSPTGTLADIAPTLLDTLSISMPQEMTGHSLLQKG